MGPNRAAVLTFALRAPEALTLGRVAAMLGLGLALPEALEAFFAGCCCCCCCPGFFWLSTNASAAPASDTTPATAPTTIGSAEPPDDPFLVFEAISDQSNRRPR